MHAEPEFEIPVRPLLYLLDLSDSTTALAPDPSWPLVFPGLQQLLLHSSQPNGSSTLTGGIPASWGAPSAWQSLQRVTLWGNAELCGPIPDSASGIWRWCLDTSGTNLGGRLCIFHGIASLCSQCSAFNDMLRRFCHAMCC